MKKIKFILFVLLLEVICVKNVNALLISGDQYQLKSGVTYKNIYRPNYNVTDFDSTNPFNTIVIRSELESSNIDTFLKIEFSACINKDYDGEIVSNNPYFKYIKTNQTCKRQDNAPQIGLIYKFQIVNTPTECMSRNAEGFRDYCTYFFEAQLKRGYGRFIYIDIFSHSYSIFNPSESTGEKIDETNDKIDDTNQKLDETNKNLTDINDTLNDTTPPNTDIGSLGNVQGLLPPGPVDSLLNIPFQFLSILTSSFSGTCVPLEGEFVFGSKLSLPCFSEIFYGRVPSYLIDFLSLIPSAFILIKYFKHLYKKVDRAVSMETNSDDEWGVL